MEIDINATKDQIEEFKTSILWSDIVRELESWKKGFNDEMMSIVDNSVDDNPSTATVLLHMGDINGRQKTVDYVVSILDVFLSILETKEIKGEEETNGE